MEVETDTRNPGVMLLAVAGGILLALVLAVATYQIVTSDDHLKCSQERAERAFNGGPPVDCDD